MVVWYKPSFIQIAVTSSCCWQNKTFMILTQCHSAEKCITGMRAEAPRSGDAGDGVGEY